MHLTDKKISHEKIGFQKEALNTRISSALKKIETLIAKAHGEEYGKVYLEWKKELHTIRNGLPAVDCKEGLSPAKEGVCRIEKFLSMGEINPAAPILIYKREQIKSAIELFAKRFPNPEENNDYAYLKNCLKNGFNSTKFYDIDNRLSELDEILGSNPPIMNKAKKPEPDGRPIHIKEAGKHDPPPFTHLQNHGKPGKSPAESSSTYIIIQAPKNPITPKVSKL